MSEQNPNGTPQSAGWSMGGDSFPEVPPVSPANQQPGYGQPGYSSNGGFGAPVAPAHPGYVPTQPGYAPSQPEYGSAQPGYGYGQPAANSQPGYGYGQPGYGYANPGSNGTGGPRNGAFTWAQAKPGIVPIRPLQLSDLFSGSFSLLRYNPKAVLGIPALMIVVGTILSSFLVVTSSGALVRGIAEGDSDGFFAAFFGFSAIPLMLASLLATGPLAIVTLEAVKGRKISVGDTWKAFKPRIWKYLAVTLITSILISVLSVLTLIAIVFAIATIPGNTSVGILSAILFLFIVVLITAFLMYAAYMKFIFAGPIVVTTDLGVFASIGRAWKLTNKRFLRLLGTGLLFMFVVNLGLSLLSTPFTILLTLPLALSGSDPTASGLIGVLPLIFTAFISFLTVPLYAGFHTLLYVDQRIRLEGYDIELLTSGELN
ncbi:MAG: hypothetical protein Q4D73_07130 [Actinomycetaceae bacterium]|nr:hypothetical protein [Actinomycetaceae bacterium]